MKEAEKFFFEVKNFIKKHHLISKDDKILCALSGGMDSVCLLHILANLKKPLGFNLACIHINHNLRTKDSNKDEAFAKEMSKSLNIPCYSKSVDVKAFATNNKISNEEAARILRYKAFEQIKTEFLFDKIACAHHANDQAETLIMRFCKGSLLGGLRGMDPLSKNRVIRPLLQSTKEQISAYLKENNLNFRQDNSNENIDIMRNNIRHKIIPQLKEAINNNIIKTLSEKAIYFSYAKQYFEDNIEKLAHDLQERVDDKTYYLKKNIRDESKFIRISIVHQILQTLLKSHENISLKHLEACDEEILKNNTGSSLNLPKGIVFATLDNYYSFSISNIAL
ncbi:MAG: tRNA lysidine(34) synthetase TilS [Pseudomonadota bacterium]